MPNEDPIQDEKSQKTNLNKNEGVKKFEDWFEKEMAGP
jgi:hypothetical protein